MKCYLKFKQHLFKTKMKKSISGQAQKSRIRKWRFKEYFMIYQIKEYKYIEENNYEIFLIFLVFSYLYFVTKLNSYWIRIGYLRKKSAIYLEKHLRKSHFPHYRQTDIQSVLYSRSETISLCIVLLEKFLKSITYEYKIV